MKPTLPLNATNTRRESRLLQKLGAAQPKTDYQFRSGSFNDFAGRCHGSPEPSFRRISDDYFKNEARGQFVSEASAFGLIVAIAAVPVIEGVRVAWQCLHATGVL